VIDYESEFTVKEQVAADLRRRIADGEWGPRRRLPTVVHLTQQYGVAKDTVALALGMLRDLGVIYTVPNRGSFVRLGADNVTVVTLGPGDRGFIRQPSENERTDLDLGEDVMVLVVERAGGEVEVLPADKVELSGEVSEK
jgi:DNA-binding transcriptional regulator YhcF (GntR family)